MNNDDVGNVINLDMVDHARVISRDSSDYYDQGSSSRDKSSVVW